MPAIGSPLRRRRFYPAAVLLAGSMALAGCGSSAAPAHVSAPSTQSATTAGGATSGPAVQPSATKIPIGKRTGDCGDAKLAVNLVVNAATDVSNDVTSIDADPTCTELILSTVLDRSAAAEAQELCEAVARSAFTNGFSTVSVRVVGQGHVAAGNIVRAVDGGPCTGV